MIKTPINLQDLRRKIYSKAKADTAWRFWGLYVHICKMETLRQAYELAKDSCRRAIQAAVGISPLPTAAQRDNEKSGVALQRIQMEADMGSYHFIDGYDRALRLAGRVMDQWIPIVYDNERTKALRQPDDSHRMVLGLDKENFQIFENKQSQPLQSFSRTDMPISIGLIFDTSGSMSTKIDRAREAVTAFLKTANPEDEFFVITFADTPTGLVDFTTSTEEVQNKLLFATPRGMTSLLDAIYLGVSKLRQAQYSKKALLIISDGGDNHSRYTERDVRNIVKESDVMIYAIGVYDRYFRTEEERLGPGLLSDISELTGGRSFSLDNLNDLPDVASKIGVELRNQYVLGYRPTKAARDGKWHKIKVKLLAPKGLPPLQVNARQGYYARTE